MFLHVIHGLIVVLIVLSFPLTTASLVCLFDDGGSLHRGE